LIATECDYHAGLRVFEDQVQLEVVDDGHRPVAPGEPGRRLLVTNLFNRTQPLIRYELNDLVTVSPDPCPCGRPFPLLETVEGRGDGRARAAGDRRRHDQGPPGDAAQPVGRNRKAVGVQNRLRGRRAARRGRARRRRRQQACREIETGLGTALAERGAQVPSILVESVAEIPRHPHSGKHKVIEVQGA